MRSKFNYGYLVVFGSFLFMFLSFGVVYNFGVFFNSIQTEFGWSRGAISGAFSLLMLVSGIAGVFAGKIADKYGPFTITVVAAITLGLGYILLSFTQSLAWFYICHVVLSAIGVGSALPALLPVISNYFTKNRGFMTGLAASGIAVAALVICPLTRKLILIYGWQKTYLILGIVIFIVLGCVSLIFIKITGKKPSANVNAVKNEGDTLKMVLRNYNFYILCILYFLFGYGLQSVMVHIIPYTTDMGYAVFAVKMIAIIGALNMLTRVLGAWISDRLGVKLTLMLHFACLCIAFTVIVSFTGFNALVLFAILFGLAYGGVMVLPTIAVIDYFGKRSSGFLLGIIIMLNTLGGSIGPLVSGILFDVKGNYKLAFTICLVLAIITFLLSIGLSKPRYSMAVQQHLQKQSPVNT